MIKLLIFDLDGTLIDSAPDIIQATNTLLVRHGHDPLPDHTIKAAIGEGAKQLVFSLFPETHERPNLHVELEREYFEIYRQCLVDRTTLMPGAKEFLDSWRGDVALVTNKRSDLMRETLNRLGLMKYHWKALFGADSLPNRKPDPLPLIEAMKASGASASETLMIGDGIPDMIAARRAGVHSLGLTFGYTDPEILQAQGASLLVSSFQEMPSSIERADRLPAREILPA